MSEGTIRQFVDYTDTNDDNQNEPGAIQPIVNGENVVGGLGGIANRPPENLRLRSEVIRGVLEDLRYLIDADRHLLLVGPGLVSWPGEAPGPGYAGIFTLSDDIKIVPALTPGLDSNEPPVQSTYGTLQLENSIASGGILCTSMRRSYSGGDQISVEVVADAAFSVTMLSDKRTILVTAIVDTTTLLQVKTAINALVDGEATQFVNATYYDAGADGQFILAPQDKQFVAGNYDGEAHLITPANLAAFFALDGMINALREGDSLCIWYEYLIDPGTPATLGGRRQSIVENTNTTVPVGSFFNSRLHPERLVNAIPIAKVLDSLLQFVNGTTVPAGAEDYSLTDTGTWGPGPAWFDSTTNPATTVVAQITKIITDLGAAAGTGSAKIGAPIAPGTPHAWATAGGLDTRFADLLGWGNGHWAGTADKHDADKIIAPTAAGTPFNWSSPGDVAAHLADLLGWTNIQAEQFGEYAGSGVIDLDYGSAAALLWSITGGDYWMSGERITKGADNVTLTNGATNYVYIDTDGDLKATIVASVAFTLPRLVLAKAIASGGVVTEETDLRRFITRQNDKDYVTVGGSNADFATMEGVIEWCRQNRSTGVGTEKPTRIQILGDVTVTSMIDLDFPVEIHGNAPSVSSTPGIYAPAGSYAFRFMAGSSGSRFHGIHCCMSTVASGSGFFQIGTSEVAGVSIENCIFVGGNNTYVINLSDDAYAWRIQNNTFKGLTGTGAFIGGSVASDRCQIQNNRFEMLTFTASHIYADLTRGLISSNTFTGGLQAVRLDGSDTMVLDNQIYAAYSYGVFSAGLRTVVRGNFINAALDSNDAVRCNGVDSTIENNIINNWTIGHGIFATGARAKISGNRLLGDPGVESTFGPGIEASGGFAMVCNNHVDMKPGASASDGCENARGILTGKDVKDNTITGNVVMNCGDSGDPTIGAIYTGARSIVTNNRVNNTYGEAYALWGGDQVVTGNRGDSIEEGYGILLSADSSEEAHDCLVTGNFMDTTIESYATSGTPVNNRFWNNHGTVDMAQSGGLQAHGGFYKTFNPTSQSYTNGVTVYHASYFPENGYAGFLPQKWQIPPKLGNVTSGLTFYFSDGSTVERWNTTGLEEPNGRDDTMWGKDGPGIIRIRFMSKSTATEEQDVGMFSVDGEMV